MWLLKSSLLWKRIQNLILVLFLGKEAIYLKFVIYILLNIYGVESIVLGEIFKLEILMDFHVEKSLESEKQFFSSWSMCVYLCVCVRACIYFQHNLKLIIPETSNLVFHVCTICKYNLEFFIKIRQIVCM